jgi:FAD/FMN-containing dehydrogenase
MSNRKRGTEHGEQETPSSNASDTSTATHDFRDEAGRGTVVNDVHSRLNRTKVKREYRPSSVSDVQRMVRRSRQANVPISVCGSRHAMGGQQFGTDSILFDMTGMNRIHNLDGDNGIVDVEAGIQWPQLIDELHQHQPDAERPWTIRQKQTGADRLSLGGALSANAHGRGLTMGPMVQDVESIDVVTPDGTTKTCSRTRHPEWFRTVIGGYGLFGIITRVRLRLDRRRKVRRHVDVCTVDRAVEKLTERADAGHRYGDFQFSIDAGSEGFLKEGVLATYEPVDDSVPVAEDRRSLSEEDWLSVVKMAHDNDPELFDRYANYYRSTDGQVYCSDTHQLSTYVRDYHNTLCKHFDEYFSGSEMITEVYVPRDELADYMNDARRFLRQTDADVIYGTVRLIEEDEETFLPWAAEDYACVIFNLHVDHEDESIRRAKRQFRGLIDRAIERDGRFYLTYHRWATVDQVRACYPRFDQFFRRKKSFDPEERFVSDWYRHYRRRGAGQ